MGILRVQDFFLWYMQGRNLFFFLLGFKLFLVSIHKNFFILIISWGIFFLLLSPPPPPPTSITFLMVHP